MVNSLSDLFHADVAEEFIAMVLAVMALAPQHTFQLLTKRHARMRSLLNKPAFISLVQKATLDISRDHLKVAAAARDDLKWPLPNVWVGVSVEDQRWAQIRIPALLDPPAATKWLRDQCLAAGVPFHFKQWADITPYDQMTDAGRAAAEKQAGMIPSGLDRGLPFRVGKKRAGRTFGGDTWDQYPLPARNSIRRDGRST